VADFSHFNGEGRARMVDVGGKAVTRRVAVAAGRVLVSRETFDLIRSGGMKKGDVLGTAQIGGIMGAKRTPDIIPMCHPIMINGVDIDFEMNEKDLAVEITASVKCSGVTGVEMEALTAVSVAALTVYDMCKAVQKDMVIDNIHLLSKSGGKSGDYRWEDKHGI
jgi:cyclic pyranopterin phosphate synthase